jgi:hypothetical protein
MIEASEGLRDATLNAAWQLYQEDDDWGEGFAMGNFLLGQTNHMHTNVSESCTDLVGPFVLFMFWDECTDIWICIDFQFPEDSI